MKTYDHGYEDSKDSEKSGTGGKNSARSMVLRYIESLSQEQIYRMIDTHTQSRFIKRKDDPTGREIMRRSMEQNGFTIQAKLEISTPEDAHEKQADDLANAVSENNTSKSQNILNEKPADVQTKGEGGSLTTTPEFDQQLSATKGKGQSLDDATKEKLEQHTGTDLSDVKIHTGSTASTLSEGINAKAFTHGQDIYFKNGNYDPKSPEGEKLLSHEVAHTVQQGDGVQAKIQRKVDELTLVEKGFTKLDPPRRESTTTSVYLYPDDKEVFPDPFDTDYIFDGTELFIMYESPEWFYVEAPVFGQFYTDFKQGFIRKGNTVLVVDLPTVTVTAKALTEAEAKEYAKKFYTAFNDPAWFSNTDEEAITDLITELSFESLLLVNEAYKKEYAPDEDDLDIFEEFFDELNEDEFKKILPIIENKRIEDVFRKIGEGVDFNQHIALSGNVLLLRYFLYQTNVDEKQVVALMQELGTADSTYVLNNKSIRKDAAGALSFTEMCRALSNRNFPLAGKLKWMDEGLGGTENTYKPGYENVKFMFLAATEEDKKEVVKYENLSFLSRHFTVAEIPEIMDDLHAELFKRMLALIYMDANQTQLLQAIQDAPGDQRKTISTNSILIQMLKDRLDAKGDQRLEQLLKEPGPLNAVQHGKSVLTIVDEALNLTDIPEEKVLEYLKVMSNDEKAIVADYSNNNYLERMATAFTTQEMSEALLSLPIELYHKVYWIGLAYTGKVTRTFEYERDLRIHVLTTINQDEKNDFDNYHIGEEMMSETEYAQFWMDMGTSLPKRLKYMLEDKDYTYNITSVLDSILASTYEERQAVLADKYLMDMLHTRFPVTYMSRGERYLRINEALALEKTDYEKGVSTLLENESEMEWANIQLQLPDLPPGESLARATFKADGASLEALAKQMAGLDPGLPSIQNKHHVPFFVENGDPYIGSQTPVDAVEMTVSIQIPGKMQSIGDGAMVDMMSKTMYDYFFSEGGKLPQGMTDKNFMNGIKKYIWDSVNRGKSYGYEKAFAEILGWNQKTPFKNFTDKFGLTNKKWGKIFGGQSLKYSEASMWDALGLKAKTEATIIRVEMGQNSPFSIGKPGSFLLGGDLKRIKVIKATKKFFEVLLKLSPGKEGAVGEMMNKGMQNFKGQRVLGVLKVAGRVMMIIGIGTDLIKIVYAKDKLKTTTSITSGWVAGLAAAGVYTTMVGPLAAEGGPWAWLAFGLGELIVFSVAYFAAAEGVAYIYELTLEDW